MSIASGWLHWTERKAGPEHKRYSVDNAGEGIVWHSMEGGYLGSVGELLNPNRQASWMFSLKKDGVMVQHYPIQASCWASGNMEANTRYWSVELEGFADQPINAAQQVTAKRLIAEWERWHGAAAKRRVSMWEHREVATLSTPNAGPTACPSERYAPLWAALDQEDEPMTPAERAEFDALKQTVSDLANIVVRNGIDTDGDGKVDMTGDAALAHAVVKGWSAFYGAGLAQKDIADHKADHPVTGEGIVTGTFTGVIQ